MVSSRDVARLAKVSQSTVSRAYREDVYIDPNTRKRVFEAAKQLGYYPNFSARSLRNQQSRIIGLMLSDPNNSFFAPKETAFLSLPWQERCSCAKQE